MRKKEKEELFKLASKSENTILQNIVKRVRGEKESSKDEEEKPKGYSRMHHRHSRR